ncbi:MAG: NACHT domain-containing protein [Chlorobium sp.]|nr:MAG: NACHT domain-containing protein [Chlorobium sp.]
MADNGITKVKILVASPGDVDRERQIVEDVIGEWNIRNGDERKMVLEAILWEKHAAPENCGDGEGPQAPITRQIVDDCDCAIGIFWHRIGTPTKLAEGGAVEEVQRMLTVLKRPVMLYFSRMPIALHKVDGEQVKKLEAFKTLMKKDGLVWEYDNRTKFRTHLSRHLDKQIRQWFCTPGAPTVKQSIPEDEELRRYQSALKEELGYIRMLGMPGVESVKVNLDDETFVPLRLSDRQDMFSGQPEKDSGKRPEGGDHTLYPDAIMKRAFHDRRHRRMLLVIGDPGAGKTTLLKYYALCALDSERSSRLGFSGPVNVFYLPLRELVRHENGQYHSLPANLALWLERNQLPFTAEQFDQWLQSGTALVLLDGLDEISNTDDRKEVCRWIDAAWKSFSALRFVVTSRATGYRQEEGVELAADFERADVQDFTVDQQELFLLQWFTAAFLKEPCDVGVDEAAWLAKQKAKAEERTRTIAKHLKEEKNKGLRQLAAIPMILQIMAILWKDRDYMPESRVKLYEAAIDYLLEFRDKRRGITPLVSAVRARKVLGPVSLWMQEDLKKDEAEKESMQAIMKERLEILDHPPSVEAFCDYMVKRAGLLVEYGGGKAYLFRHKSLREYLAGVQLAKKVNRTPDSLDNLVSGFGDDWWEEPIKFFIAQEDEEIFDLFMEKLFDSPVSEELTPKKQFLLQTIIEEAPEKKVDALCTKLLDTATTASRQRVILDCLKTIAKPAALSALEQFIAQQLDKENAENSDVIDRAEEVIIALGGKALERATEKSISGKPLSIRNPNEQNAEYILIPGGNYWYSAMKKTLDVGDCYVAKYPVTNKLYRSFIKWLEGKDSGKNHASSYRAELERIAQSNEWGPGFGEYLKGESDLAALFRSENDEDRKFDGDDQPVVGVTWYAASAYCLWLSMLEGKAARYRLAHEIEWEWAAGGKQGTIGEKVREYPWPDEMGDVNPKLLNSYESNIHATTPVGSYPEGATPEGLYDMAGNVWEWCCDWYGDDGTFANPLGPETGSYRVLRGGSWNLIAEICRSANRYRSSPDYRNFNVGFRLVFVP